MKKYVKPQLDFITLTSEEKYAAGSRDWDCVKTMRTSDADCIIMTSQCTKPV